MAKFNGTSILVTVDGDAIAEAQEHSIEVSHNLADASTKDSAGWAEFISAQRGATINVSALVDYAADTDASSTGFFDLFTEGIVNRTEFTLVFGTTASGNTIMTAQAYLTSLSQNAPSEDVVSYSASFQITGAITTSTNV